jgi:STE24 endopeptidase
MREPPRRVVRAPRGPALNGWAAFVLVALLVDVGLELLAGALNLRALATPLPPELRALYDPARHERARAYTRARLRFAQARAVFDLALLLAFWFAGGFGALDDRLRALGAGPIGTGLLFLGALGAGSMLVHLPLRWWSTFVIEERFGFNRTTPRTFWTDVAKGALLAVLLGAPLAAAILWLFVDAGDRAWLWCWLVGTAWVVAIQFVAPTWIMPLFNRFAPLADGTLRDAIVAYARTADFPLDGVFVMDGSRRSTKANALFTGFGRHKRIALFDTLIATLAPPELVAVVAHEIGHYKRRHVLQGMAIAVAHMGVVLWLLQRCLAEPRLYAAFFVREPSVHAGSCSSVCSSRRSSSCSGSRCRRSRGGTSVPRTPSPFPPRLERAARTRAREALRREPLEPDAAPALRRAALLPSPAAGAARGTAGATRDTSVRRA